MKIQVLSDLHIEFREPEIEISSEADLVVVAGDVGPGIRGALWLLENIKSIPIVYVSGNHEYYSYYRHSLDCGYTLHKNIFGLLDNEIDKTVMGTNLHYLRNNFVEIGDYVFVGGTLWTDFSALDNQAHALDVAPKIMNDYKKIFIDDKEKISSKTILAEFSKTVDYISKFKGKKNIVVVTHHAPSLRSLQAKSFDDCRELMPYYASDLEVFVQELSPVAWIHGHVPDLVDYTIGKTRIVSAPLGHKKTKLEVKLVEI